MSVYSGKSKKIVVRCNETLRINADVDSINILVEPNVHTKILVVPKPNENHCAISVRLHTGSRVFLIHEISKVVNAQSISYRFLIDENAALEFGLAAESESKNNFSIDAHLNGKGASIVVLGFYLARMDTNLNLIVNTHHHAMRTKSIIQLYGALYDRASVSYTGKTIVAQNAQQVEADQQNRNLILSPLARASSLPEMEIAAHQVRCAHGSALGKHSEAELFYLQTRGFWYDQAQYLLTEGFLSSSLNTASDYTATQLKQRLRELL